MSDDFDINDMIEGMENIMAALYELSERVKRLEARQFVEDKGLAGFSVAYLINEDLYEIE